MWCERRFFTGAMIIILGARGLYSCGKWILLEILRPAGESNFGGFDDTFPSSIEYDTNIWVFVSRYSAQHYSCTTTAALLQMYYYQCGPRPTASHASASEGGLTSPTITRKSIKGYSAILVTRLSVPTAFIIIKLYYHQISTTSRYHLCTNNMYPNWLVRASWDGD